MSNSTDEWTVLCLVSVLNDVPDYQSPVVVVDVGSRCIRLELGSPNTEIHGERTGAVIRRFLEGDCVDWSKAVSWLDGSQARALMHTVDAGIVRSQLWSGDVVIDWTESAKGALDALFTGIDASLYG